MSKPQPASALSHEEDLESISDEQIQTGMRRLAKIRANLKNIRTEISESILDNIRTTRELTKDVMDIVGEIDATTNQTNDS